MSTTTTTTEPLAEEALTGVGIAVATTARVIEAAAIGVATVFIAPPLVILAVVVVVPLLVIGAVASIFVLPVLAIRRIHRHRSEHPHQWVHRLMARA
jgi:membrane protein YdbS with pleckstrin-like domain